MCLNPDGTFNIGPSGEPHSCCDCEDRVYLPPEHVENGYRYGSTQSNSKVILGAGWFPGNLLQRLRSGGPRKFLGRRDSP
jgi:hypothetical protein